MLIIILGMLLVPTLGWRWMIRVSIAPSLILIFLFKVCLLPSSLSQLFSLELTVPVSLCLCVLPSLSQNRLVITYLQETFQLLWRRCRK